MKYLCLIYVDERGLEALARSESGLARNGAAAPADAEGLRGGPGQIASAALEPPGAALTIRRRDGRVTTTPGAFAEAAEQLQGFMLIDAANLDEAIDVAARMPAARYGSVEVRPVRDLENAGADARGRRRIDTLATLTQRRTTCDS